MSARVGQVYSHCCAWDVHGVLRMVGFWDRCLPHWITGNNRPGSSIRLAPDWLYLVSGMKVLLEMIPSVFLQRHTPIYENMCSFPMKIHKKVHISTHFIEKFIGNCAQSARVGFMYMSHYIAYQTKLKLPKASTFLCTLVSNYLRGGIRNSLFRSNGLHRDLKVFSMTLGNFS